MEHVAGWFLMAIGLLIIVFGTNTRGGGGSGTLSRLLRRSPWIDTALNWVIGLVCCWFGAALVLELAHFG